MINGVEAFLRSMKTTLLTRPLSILTDQLFAASTNAVRVLCKIGYVSGSLSDAGISEASLSPKVEKCRFNSSAISRSSVTVCSAILISEIFPTLFECSEESSLIKCHVFLGFDLLSSKWSIKYLRLAFLLSLFVWFWDRLY